MGLIAGLIFVSLWLVYLLPTLLAFQFNHKQGGSIAILNIFLGWTFIVWVGCLAWVFSNNE